MSEISVKNIERGATDPRASTLLRIQTALEHAGVEIIQPGSVSLEGGGGVRLKNTGSAPSG